MSTDKATGNSLLRQEGTAEKDDENQHNPCYFGIYAANASEDESDNSPVSPGSAPKSMVKFYLISIQPIKAKIGFVEFTDSTSFLSFRSILLQQQPTSCILYTTHDVKEREFSLTGAFTQNQLSAKLLDSVENELTLANCPVQRQPLYNSATEPKNVDAVLDYHFLPKSLQNSPAMNDTDQPNTQVTSKARSIYPEDQITSAYNLCKAVLTGNHPQFVNSAPIITGLCRSVLKHFITAPISKLTSLEHQLAASQAQANRAKLSKLTKDAAQLPMKYLFYQIQPSTKLRIDQNTLNSIGVFPGPTESAKASTSLFGLMNQCQTTFATRLLQSWLKQPLLDIYELNQRQLTVAALTQSHELLAKLRGALRGIADIEKILAKLNKYYNQTEACTNSRHVTSVMSGDIIKELLSLFGFVIKMRSILGHLSQIAVTTSKSTDDQGRYHLYPEEDELYDTVTQSFENVNEETGQVETQTFMSSVLKPEQLLKHSIKMTSQQFLQIKYTRELSTILSGLDQFQNLVQSTIDLEAAAKHEFLIKPDINDDLTEISKRKGKIFRALERLHAEAAQHLGTDKSRVKMQYTSANDLGWHLKVTRKDEKLIRAEASTYQTLDTRKDGVRFTTTNFSRLSEQYQEETAKYQLVQATTCLEILDAAMTYCSDFYSLMTIVAELDVLSSFANLVVSSPRKYVRPQLISTTGVSIGPNIVDIANLVGRDESTDGDDDDYKPSEALSFDFGAKRGPGTERNAMEDGKQNDQNGQNSKKSPISGHIMLTAARHPTVEAQPNVVFIPNDVHLKHGETELQLITGPNMGGKSCYLRMAALIVLMAQVGCYVPCDQASICLVDCILARVGAGDMQLKGVSTFMKEMLETGEILHHGSANSLIVVDELGRGTSTYDGFGLAWGIAEYLATRVHSYTLFATHFHEMTAMSEQFKTVANKHVTALTGDDSITMLYKVQDGHCDRSFGIHVAKMANFPKEVITAARAKADALEAYAQQNLLQANLPLKYGDKVAEAKHLTEDQVIAMDEGASPSPLAVPSNSFALATTPFTEEKSFEILKGAFGNGDFVGLLERHDVVNHEDVAKLNKTDLIASVYNATTKALVQ